MPKANTEHRGVEAVVEIVDWNDDSDVLEEGYVEVLLTINGKHIAAKRTDGKAYGPSYTAVVRADKKVEG